MSSAFSSSRAQVPAFDMSQYFELHQDFKTRPKDFVLKVETDSKKGTVKIVARKKGLMTSWDQFRHKEEYSLEKIFDALQKARQDLMSRAPGDAAIRGAFDTTQEHLIKQVDIHKFAEKFSKHPDLVRRMRETYYEFVHSPEQKQKSSAVRTIIRNFDQNVKVRIAASSLPSGSQHQFKDLAQYRQSLLKAWDSIVNLPPDQRVDWNTIKAEIGRFRDLVANDAMFSEKILDLQNQLLQVFHPGSTDDRTRAVLQMLPKGPNDPRFKPAERASPQTAVPEQPGRIVKQLIQTARNSMLQQLGKIYYPGASMSEKELQAYQRDVTASLEALLRLSPDQFGDKMAVLNLLGALKEALQGQGREFVAIQSNKFPHSKAPLPGLNLNERHIADMITIASELEQQVLAHFPATETERTWNPEG